MRHCAIGFRVNTRKFECSKDLPTSMANAEMSAGKSCERTNSERAPGLLVVVNEEQVHAEQHV